MCNHPPLNTLRANDRTKTKPAVVCYGTRSARIFHFFFALTFAALRATDCAVWRCFRFILTGIGSAFGASAVSEGGSFLFMISSARA